MITPRASLSLFILTSASAFVGCEDSHPLAPEVIPFHGTTTGMLLEVAPAPAGRCPVNLPMLFRYEGTGTATDLGLITVSGTECAFIDPENPANFASGNSEFVITAANGDELHLTYDQTVISFEAPPSPWLLWSAEPYATGGSGRYEAAELVGVTWSGGGNLMTNETYSTIDGEIRIAR